jgi:hypothetical protein
VIAPIYDEMRAAFGEEKAREVLRRAIRRAAVATGAEMRHARPRLILDESRMDVVRWLRGVSRTWLGSVLR